MEHTMYSTNVAKIQQNSKKCRSWAGNKRM